jgi:hypothetical protein
MERTFDRLLVAQSSTRTASSANRKVAAVGFSVVDHGPGSGTAPRTVSTQLSSAPAQHYIVRRGLFFAATLDGARAAKVGCGRPETVALQDSRPQDCRSATT